MDIYPSVIGNQVVMIPAFAWAVVYPVFSATINAGNSDRISEEKYLPDSHTVFSACSQVSCHSTEESPIKPDQICPIPLRKVADYLRKGTTGPEDPAHGRAHRSGLRGLCGHQFDWHIDVHLMVFQENLLDYLGWANRRIYWISYPATSRVPRRPGPPRGRRGCCPGASECAVHLP